MKWLSHKKAIATFLCQHYTRIGATVAVDTTNVPNEYFVFSALASITGGGSATNATQKIQARLTDGTNGNVILAELDFDPSQRTKQVQATTVCLNRGVHNLAVKLLISDITASITLKDVRLTASNSAAQTEVSNINTRMQNFSEHSSVGAKVWYKAAPVNLIAEHSKIELLSEVKFTVKDFNLTKLSYLKNPQNFNVWYNDGAEFLHTYAFFGYILTSVALVNWCVSATKAPTVGRCLWCCKCAIFP